MVLLFFFNLPQSCSESKFMKIGSNFFLFLQLCQHKWHHRIQREKIYNPRIFKIDFRANGASGNAKNVFGGGSAGVKIRFWTSQHSYITKTFEMHQGCVFLGAESDGTIYFGPSAEMTKIPVIFYL